MGVGRMKKRSCMPLVSRKIAQTGVALLVLFVLAALFRGRASERARWPQEAGQIKYSNFAKRMARAKQQRIIIWRKCAKEAVTGGVPGWAGWLGRPWMFGNVRIFFCFSFVCVYFGLILVRFLFFFFGRQSLQTFPKPLLQFLVSSRNEGKNRAPWNICTQRKGHKL